MVMEERGWSGVAQMGRWLDRVTSGKVDVEDLEEVVDELRKL